MKSVDVLSIVVVNDLSEFLKFGFVTLNLPFTSSSVNVKFVSRAIPFPR